MIALDTNILLRYAQSNDPDYPVVSTAIRTLHARGETLRIFPQLLYEFWATATRPVSAENRRAIQKNTFVLVPDSPNLLAE